MADLLFGVVQSGYARASLSSGEPRCGTKPSRRPTSARQNAMSARDRAPPAAASSAPTRGLAESAAARASSVVASPQARLAAVAPASTTLPTGPLGDRYRKRGRVESAGNERGEDRRVGNSDGRLHAATVVGERPRDCVGSPNVGLRHRTQSQRSSSLPNIYPHNSNEAAMLNFFPDVNPRDLRLAEVRSWYSPWMDRQFPVAADEINGTNPPRLSLSTASRQPKATQTTGTQRSSLTAEDDFDAVAQQLVEELALEDRVARIASEPVLPVASPPSSTSKPPKRPVLRLKLEDMPTPQQAEDRANRAATRIIARREAMEKAMNNVVGDNLAPVENGKSATQQAIMRLNFKSYSSGDESDVASPTGRFSAGSAYSPNHGMFTTKMVAVSEAGISSPDSASLHLQENLQRVKEIGRGASGVVYKSIHIPTLKVVAVKDVPVYGRGQRRQMVRELHALYSNLVPISNDEAPPLPHATGRPHRPSNGKPRASPHIVSFYDAFVDRAKNCICLVMEYMSAGSLQDIVLRGGCQNEKVLSRLAAGVLQGLSHIHSKNMVHRDIKPHNLLTNRQGEVKISDFGLAKTLNDNAGMTKTFVGTLLYMAPERIGGGDYSYPADIWSFGLALVSVALGKYPLPTQDGFFGLVDTVANEELLSLPEDKFSPNCRDFIRLCLKTDPSLRPPADELLRHPFITLYSQEETLKEWLQFIEATQLCEDRTIELDSLGEAVYRHLYERNAKFSCQPQSDYGISFTSRSSQTTHRRDVSIPPVQMSLQLGLANYLGVPVHQVYEVFEQKRGIYNDKLLEDNCFSPQSWSASPGVSRRQQLFGSENPSPPQEDDRGASPSIWKKIHDGFSKLKKKKKRKDSVDASTGERRSLRTTTR